MKMDSWQMIEALRNKGYAIAVIPPEKIPDHFDPRELETLMEERGHDAIETPIDDRDDEPYEMSDIEADADTLKSIGWGTDEDYGGTDERY
jgi:hypothetical protein